MNQGEEEEEEEEPEVEEVVNDGLGWKRLAGGAELVGQTKGVLDIEKRVEEATRAGVQKRRCGCVRRAAIVLAALRDNAASDLPAAVCPERPEFSVSRDHRGPPASPANDRPARFVEQARHAPMLSRPY